MKKALLVAVLATGAVGIGIWGVDKQVEKDEQAVKEWKDIFGKMDQYLTIGVIGRLQNAAKLIVKKADLSPKLLKMAKEVIAVEQNYYKRAPELAKVRKIHNEKIEELVRDVLNNKKFSTEGLSDEETDKVFHAKAKKSEEIKAKYESRLEPYKDEMKFTEEYFEKRRNWPNLYNTKINTLIGPIFANAMKVIGFEIQYPEGPRPEQVVTKSLPAVSEGNKEDFLKYADDKVEAEKFWQIAMQIKKGLESNDVQQKIYSAAVMMAQQVIKDKILTQSQLQRIKEIGDIIANVLSIEGKKRSGSSLNEQEQSKLTQHIKALQDKVKLEMPPEKEWFGGEENIQKLLTSIMSAVLDAAEQAIDERLAGK